MDSYWRLKNLVNDLPVTNPSSRQGSSIYSWTVDQFQTSLGKNCGSMNMDELVKNICSAEETQGALQRQGSTSLPRTLSHKTVDEVWKYITQEEETKNYGVTNISHLQRQQTLGEITLEEFLIRSGARINNTSNVSIHDSSSLISGYPNTSLDVEFQPNAMVPMSHESNLHQNVNVSTMSAYQPQQPIMSRPNGYSYGQQIRSSNGVQGNKRSLVPSVAKNPSGTMACSSVKPFPILNKTRKIDGESSLLSSSPYIFSGNTSTRGRKIDINAITAENKLVDKKLKRKIKNRESAARSRARKQAQTMELEAELEKLKKQYEELLKQQVDLRKMLIEPGMINRQGEPERKLRRTKSDIM
ncbi:hypothetical protein CARUB_v10027656mg [Capsella rubella]|uniref:BZIP domain-containing protein n=1 Tax=Capsella rubella TaxID=81985 RepID=R0EYV1_9BRAS|nr:ABSCISIC ACID-INSENSITIVE 5-like protein 8 [Capsella rubella]EOA14452.1 hypothetical protein CARUB_v10027656mg [Capsella rubella]